MTYAVPTVASPVSFAQWSGDMWNFGAMLNDLLNWYAASFGTGIFGTSMFVGAILLLICGVQAIRQESLLLPGSVLAIICSSTELYGVVPLSMQPLFLTMFVILPIVAVIYEIYKKR
jgi:hypothetical protein